MSFRAVREEVRVIASNACFGPTPLRCGFGWAPRDQALRSQGSSNKDELSRDARGGEGMGSVPPIYTKGDTPYYTADFALAPQNQACTRRKARTRGSFRAGALGGIGVHVQMLASARYRCRLGSRSAAGIEKVPGRWKRNSRDPFLGIKLDAFRPALIPPREVQGRSSRRSAS
jgi:hypothetical protein